MLVNGRTEGAAHAHLGEHPRKRVEPIQRSSGEPSVHHPISFRARLALAFTVTAVIPMLAAIVFGLAQASDLGAGSPRALSQAQLDGLLVLAVAIAILFGLFAARWLTSPLVELTRVVDMATANLSADHQGEGDARALTTNMALTTSTVPEVAHLAHAFQSIRERLRACMRECERATAQYQTLLEAAPDAVLMVRPDGRIAVANRQAEQLFGYREEELAGLTVQQLLPDWLRASDGQQPAIVAPGPRLRASDGRPALAGRQKDGRHIPVEVSLSPLEEDDGDAGIAIVRNVGECERVEAALRKLAHSISAVSGQNFFTSFVCALADAIEIEIAFIGRIVDGRPDRIETVAMAVDGAIVENFSYDLAGTPSRTIVGQNLCVYAEGVRARFPNDRGLAELSVEGYAGTPLTSSTGQQLGLLAVMSRRPLQNSSIVESVLRIFATRASAELERFDADEALRESEARYAVTARGSNDGLWDWDLRTDTLHCSERWRSIVGVERAESPESSRFWFDRLHPDDAPRMRTALDAHLRGDVEHFKCEARMRDTTGSYRWTLCRGLAVRDAEGTPIRIAGSLSDVTDRRLAEERLLHDAMHDALTGLPNRTLFGERLRQALKRTERYGARRFAVLYMDLDRFKLINDSLGHGVGDELLIAVARRLVTCVRESDTIARLGGDEYGILLEDVIHDDEAVQIAERIQQSLRMPCELSSHSVVVTASIGVVLGPDDYQLPTDLLRDADIAMYRAKELGHARHVTFDSSLHGRALALLELESDLRRALDHGELRLHYQPIVDTANNTVTGVEALARWPHPTRGMVPPGEFIGYAEESGLIVPLGDWVLRTALEQMRAWEERGLAPERICVNLSARQLHQADLVDRIAALLHQNGLAPGRLEIELTEGVVVQYAESTVLALRRLRELGVRIAIDDFGTGYSSLAYLTRFPVSTVKIDRAFIVDIETNRVNQAIVNAVTTLAHTIGMHVVAEGVETAAQRELVRRLGCDELQGYLVSPGLPSNTATDWLAEWRG
jgi:diguanylate cyclase (GGDEF)-like protein/PAS domain S-box-containing protein